MKYTKYATFNCQGLNDKNKQKSLAADFIHHSITVMMLQETRIIGQGVHEIKPSDGENFLLYNSGHPNRSYGGTAFLLAKETVTRSKVSFQPISERISTLKMIANKKKYCFISVYAPTNDSTVKDPDKTRTFYEKLSDIIAKIDRNTCIVIGGDFNAKTKMRNKDQLLNIIIGNYAKSDINENGEKLIELCSLHNLRITNTFFKHKPIHQTTWTSPPKHKKVIDSKSKLPRRNPYRNQIDYILVNNGSNIKITDSKSTTDIITLSDHKPVITTTKTCLLYTSPSPRDRG